MSTRKKQTLTPAPQSVQAQKRDTVESPLVFISHDSRDADLAEAFGNLLTDASGGILKSFRSSDRKGTAGIEYGQEWYSAIMQKLDAATDVVALLTTRSINRPWILYETGVAKGKLRADNRVFGVTLGITLEEAATGPFAQFQNSPDEEDAITGIVLQLIRRHPQAAPREEAVRRQVKAFRESIANLLKSRKSEISKTAVKADETSVAKFFEEVKVLVGGVPDRVSAQLASNYGPRRANRRRHLHSEMLDGILHHPRLKDSPGCVALPVLMALSFVREDFPWIYDLGILLYQAIERGDASAVENMRISLINAIEVTASGPWLFEFADGPESERSLMALHGLLLENGRFANKPKRIVLRESSLKKDS